MTRSVAWCLLLAAGTALAADDSARAQLEQRIQLTARLIGDAGTGQRIAASGNARASAHLDEGRVHQANAEQALAAGDLDTARREVDEALRHIGQARRLAPDSQGRQAAARRRYEQRLETLERLMQAWPAPVPPAGSDNADAEDRMVATTMLLDARRLAGNDRHDEALQQLDVAETRVQAGMNRRLHQRTLDYSARASTPIDRFYEALARHEGLIELVPVALAELKPGPDARTLVERYADTSRRLRQQAVQRQQQGDLSPALADLENALLYVHRALAATGLALPAPLE
ncbi:MAG: hypothetical protein JNL87_13690 [Burkholderiaceae bacterium]|nr:hypothetical protein [Burkholderiaceae bacterium]